MKNAFANKISYFILTFLFLIIIASFLFSNFEGFSLSSGKQVATVDGTPVTIKEYQTALTRQVEFFNQMMGGSGLTQKQLEEMGIKQSVLSSLVQQKLMLNAADQMGFVVSLDEIKNEIKNMPYFKTNNQFDVNLYRNMLQRNGYIPTQFEELVGNDLKQKKIEDLFETVLVSENYVKDIMNFKSNTLTVQGVKISRQSLTPLISVSEKEVKDFLEKQDNQKRLEETYTENFSTYNKPEEVKASHILIQGDDSEALNKAEAIRKGLTAVNFKKIAAKETEDPSGKENGGDLGWFSAGRMVPEFEKVAFGLKKGEISAPVKTQFGYHIIMVEDKKAAMTRPLESVKNELARLAIQKTKSQDLDQLLKDTSKKIEAALAQNNLKIVEEISKKANGSFFKNNQINQFDLNLPQVTLSSQEADRLFQAPAGTVLDLSNPGAVMLLKVVDKNSGNSTHKAQELKTEATHQNQQLSRKAREELVKAMNSKAKVVTNPALL